MVRGTPDHTERLRMIRPIDPADTPALIRLSSSSGLFEPGDAEAIEQMIHEFHEQGTANHGGMLVYESGDDLVGMLYFAPRPFADRVWEVLMIAVDRDRQRQGIGSELLVATETIARDRNGRLMLIETSDKSDFERTRLFYRKHGYAEVARIPDYFTDGDGKASFIKRL